MLKLFPFFVQTARIVQLLMALDH